MKYSPFFIFGIICVQLLTSGCATKNVSAFSKCLQENDVKVYGTFWSKKLQEQKEIFGSHFAYIQYIECDARSKDSKTRICFENNIKEFPTWEVPGKGFVEGVKSLAELEIITGCDL